MIQQKAYRDRFNLSRLAIKYSRLTIAFWIAVTVAGLLALSSLKYALFPDITFPVVIVNASAPFDTALETETQFALPLEDKLQSIPGLDDMRTSNTAGRTLVTLAFHVGVDLPASTTAVETALATLNLPEQAEFEVIPYNLNESAVVSYALGSEGQSLVELQEIAQTHILPLIAELPGVLKVELLGIEGKSPPVQSNITIPQSIVHFNGQQSLAFQVIKREDANTLEVVDEVEQAVQQLQTDLPDVQLLLAATQADYIREATQNTISALMWAVALAIVVIFPFLRRGWATLITALAIPLSLLGTCIVMAICQFNLETITLLALALVIGIIVDDAIVEVENITRYIEAGEPPRQAALKATGEIGLTVSAATLTIVAVFLPVALMEGTIGQFFKPFGLTVSAAVLISLLVARTLSPVLAVYWLKSKILPTSPGDVTEDGKIQISHPFPGTSFYRQLLYWSLNHRKLVIGFALISFAAGVALIPLIPAGFIPKLDRGEFNITYTLPLPELPGGTLSSDSESPEKPPNNSFAWLKDLVSPRRILLNQSNQVAQDLEAVVLENPQVESVFTTVGGRGEPNKGKLYVKLKSDRTLSTAQIQDQLRQDLPTPKDAIVSVEDIQFVELAGTQPLQVAFYSDDLVALSETVQRVKTKVETLPGFVDVTITGAENSADNIVEIKRFNGQRVAYLSANLSEGQALGDSTAIVIAEAEKILPDNVTLERKGDSALSLYVLRSFGGTLGLSIACMLLFLILPFGRLLEPLVVGLSLPLALVGAMLALLFTQSDFGMISLIGLIFLLGLLDKNALLLMDYINRLRKAGLNRTEAILETGSVRLRPILMTTASTILGMLPIALGLGAGAELRQPMAVAIIGGLVTSTLLSLIVVPVLYTLLEDLWRGKVKSQGNQK